MIAALIIVFREVIEAGLVVGIVLAVTRTVVGSRLWIAAGIVGGVAGSCVVAVFTGALAAAFAGSGQVRFNAAILAVAVVMLAWHKIWMARHGREMAAQLKATGEAVSAGSQTLAALAIVVGIAVLREGAEVVLFLYGIAIADGGPAVSLVLGGLAGFVLGGAVSCLTYLGLVRIPGRYLFAVTSALIAFLAAGMAAQCVAFLEAAGTVDVLGNTVWDTSGVLSEKSILGRILHTLIGYSDAPTVLQLIAYVVVLAVIFLLMRILSPDPARKRRVAASAS
jgi:high-affinity iron transporter